MSQANKPYSSKLLQGKLASVRNKQIFVSLGTGFAWMLLAGVLLLALEMFVDWHIDLSRDSRMLLLVFDVVVLFSFFVRHIYTPLANQPNDNEVALSVEKATPEFRTRLIAATQFGQSTAIDDTGSVLVGALVEETEQMARPRNFNAIVPVDKFAFAFFLGLLVVGVGAFAYNKNPIKIGDLLKRAFLSSVPVPRDTHMESITVYDWNDPDNERPYLFARKENILIKVSIKDSSRVKHPDEAKIVIKSISGKIIKEDKAENIAPTGESGLYHFKFKNVDESFTVTASANDSFPITEEVRVVARPAVREVMFVQKYPSYTETGDVNRTAGDLRLLKGSDLKIQVNSTKRINRWQLRVTHGLPWPKGNSTERDIIGNNSTTLSATITNLVDVASLRVKLWDQDGFDSREEAEYRIKMLPDNPPVVRFLDAKRETKVTSRARLPIKVSIKDDYGIDKVVLNTTFGNSPPLPPKILSMALRFRIENGDLMLMNMVDSHGDRDAYTPVRFKLTKDEGKKITGEYSGPLGGELVRVVVLDGGKIQVRQGSDEAPSAAKPLYHGTWEESDGFLICTLYADGVDPELSLNQGKSVMHYEWGIGEYKLPAGVEINYLIEAYDRADPSPNNGASRKLIAQVVTDKEKREELVNRATDSLTGVNESASKEEKLNLELGMIIFRPREKYIAARVESMGNKVRSTWFSKQDEIKWEILGFYHRGNLAYVETSATPSVGSGRVVWAVLFPNDGQSDGDTVGVYLKDQSGYTLHKPEGLEQIEGAEILSQTLPNNIKKTFEQLDATQGKGGE